METTFEYKKREELSAADQGVYDNSTKLLGFVPHMYGVIANSPNALSRYVKAEFAPSALSAKETESVNLVVSQVNNCNYCLSFHNAFANKFGFSESQVMEIRKGQASFDPKLDALVKLAKALVEKRGHIDGNYVDNFIKAGYSKAAVIDTILLVNLRGVTNYMHAALGEFEIDFPLAPSLSI